MGSRIASLDGWRGIAILLVLFDHIQRSLPLGTYITPWTQTGSHGVTVFFVLSGFLITTGLLGNHQDLPRFYTRRFFRLMPAAWTYLLTIWFITHWMRPGMVPAREFAACIFFFRDLLQPERTLLLGHFWSLSMEEQFYLVWPALLLLLRPKRAVWFAGGAALAVAAFRFTYLAQYSQGELAYRPQVRADALLVGCLLALLLQRRADKDNVRAAQILRWVAPGLLLVFAACIFYFHTLPPLVESMAIAALFATTLWNPTSWLARLMSLRPLAWLGTISYSLYLWQQVFTSFNVQPLSLISICLIPFFACGSYYCIERPCIEFGRRLTTRTPKVVSPFRTA